MIRQGQPNQHHNHIAFRREHDADAVKRIIEGFVKRILAHRIAFLVGAGPFRFV